MGGDDLSAITTEKYGAYRPKPVREPRLWNIDSTLFGVMACDWSPLILKVFYPKELKLLIQLG